ncbi:MAG: HNH endonuclease [Desulfuromonadales bacterium]
MMFASLNRAPGSLWTGATLIRAPHKPILLLAVIDLVSRGVFDTPVLSVTSDLVEANELFNGYWRRVAPLGHNSSIAFPFSRLHNEPFWKLLSASGEPVDVGRLNITNVTQLRQHAVGAQLDEELFRMMQAPESREALRNTLLQAHFSPEAQAALAEQIAINDDAYYYSQTLYEKAHQPLVQEVLEADQYKPVVRDQAFRRVVVAAYDHRCSLCGLRIITPEGHTAVDAAHIVPWSKSQNDDIRNGMALCKLCHWAFDRGMVGVSRDYNVITSRQIGVDPNVPGVLQSMAGRGVLPPGDRDLWPAQEFLGWHRQVFRL